MRRGRIGGIKALFGGVAAGRRPAARRYRRLAYEALETRQLLSAGPWPFDTGPSALEQYLLELINRARAHPLEEAAFLGLADLNEGITDSGQQITPLPKQPLAFNLSLGAAARAHSQWMLATGQLSHIGQDGSTPDERMADAGYLFLSPWAWAENLGWTLATGDGAVAELHSLLFVDSGEAQRLHRQNLLDEQMREIGLGIASDAVAGTYLAQDFATSGTTLFLTGVVYDESLVAENYFYDPGEGLGGVAITATRTSDGQVFTTTTWEAGGYSLALAPGTYRITASGGGLAQTLVAPELVQIETQNVKVDFRAGQDVALPPSAKAGGPYRVLRGRTVILDASQSSDPVEPAGSLRYEWDLDGDGLFGEAGSAALRGDETGMKPAFSAVGLSAPSTCTVTLRVTNSLGLSATATASIEVQPAGDTIGAYDPWSARWRLNPLNGPFGPQTLEFIAAAGGSHWMPLAGDWDGDGVTTIGLYDFNTARFRLWNANDPWTSNVLDFSFNVRLPGWIPIAGDWDGNGTETIGLFDPYTAHFYLKYSNNSDPADVFHFGFNVRLVGWSPVVGDWNGDGIDTIGVYDPNRAHFYLKNSNNADPRDVFEFGFGVRLPGWIPIVGDWDGDGVDTIGLYDRNTAHWYLKNSNNAIPTDVVDFVAGSPGWLPLVGNWGLSGAAGQGGSAAAPSPGQVPGTSTRIWRFHRILGDRD